MFLKSKHFSWLLDLQAFLIAGIIAFLLCLPIEDWLANNYGIDCTTKGDFFVRILLAIIRFILMIAIYLLLNMIVTTIRRLIQSTRNNW